MVYTYAARRKEQIMSDCYDKASREPLTILFADGFKVIPDNVDADTAEFDAYWYALGCEPPRYPVPATRNDTPPHLFELKYYR